MITNPLINTTFGVLSLQELLSAMWQAGHNGTEHYTDPELNAVYLATIEDIALACFIEIDKSEIHENRNRSVDQSGDIEQARHDAHDSMVMPLFELRNTPK